MVSFVRREEMQYISTLEEICQAVHVVPIRRSRVADMGYMFRSYLTNRPFLVERDDLRPMQELINRLVQDGKFDFIHADQLTMVQFALRAANVAGGNKPKVIFDAHNAVWTIVERMRMNAPWFLRRVMGVEARRVKLYEGQLLKSVDHALAVTEVDRRGLEEAVTSLKAPQNGRTAPITVVPIAVDTRQLQPVQRKPGSKNIVTLGTLHYPPNADGIRWFLSEVFPLIRKEVPEATLTIIGKNPPQDFLAVAARHPEVINVTGYVEELTPYLQKSALMAVPVRAGGGMRVRILEAFAYGMPAVTTTVGLEGIDAVPGRDVLVADSAPEFARSVTRLLRDPALQHEVSLNGRCLAETKYDWQVILSAMKTIYE